MITTSRPSRNTPLKAITKPTRCSFFPAASSWLMCSWKMASSSCFAFSPPLAAPPCAATAVRTRGARPNKDPQDVDGDVDQCRAECGHQRGKDEQCHAGALECGLPPRREADGHHDGERLDHLDGTGEKHSSDQYEIAAVHGGDHGHSLASAWPRSAATGQPAAGTAQIRHARRRFECGPQQGGSRSAPACVATW